MNSEVSIRQDELWIKFRLELGLIYWHYIAAMSWYIENVLLCFREVAMESWLCQTDQVDPAGLCQPSKEEQKIPKQVVLLQQWHITMTSNIYKVYFPLVFHLGQNDRGQAKYWKYLALLCLLGEGFYLFYRLLLGQMFILMRRWKVLWYLRKNKRIKKFPTWNFRTARLWWCLEVSEEIVWDTSAVLSKILQV